MFKKLISLIVITILALTACSVQATYQAPSLPTGQNPGQVPFTPTVEEGQGQPAQPQTYPGPPDEQAQTTQALPAYPSPGEVTTPIQPYPGVEQPGGQGITYVPPTPSDYDPQPGDDKLARGQVFLQLANSQLRVMESYPVQVVAVLRGDLPDPCHKLRVVVNPPDSQNIVQVEVYTVIDTSQICTAVLQPFETPIALGGFAGAAFSVVVNGEVLGKFDA